MSETALERSIRLSEELEEHRLDQLEARWPPEDNDG